MARTAMIAMGLLLALLGWRVVSLERAVAELEARAAVAPTGDGRSATGAQAGTASTLATLDGEVERLRRELTKLEQATADKVTVEELDTAVDDTRILDVVDRKQAEVRQKQLAFQRDRWLGWRKDALDAFAKNVHLQPQQQAQLLQYLEEEVDSIVALMGEPGADENPWQAADRWRALLDRTDAKVRDVLDGSQLPAWDHARQTERRVLWPWLANK